MRGRRVDHGGQHDDPDIEEHLDTDVERFVEADLAFHNTLFQAVDNVFLDAVFEPLALVLRTLRTTTSSVSQIREHAIDWHARILAAVAEGDPDLSRETMRGHIMQTEQDSDQYLTERTERTEDPTGPSPTAA